MSKRLATLFCVCAALSACKTMDQVGKQTPIDQVPMYGGMDRTSVPELREGDRKLIEDASTAFGSKEKASVAWVDQGFSFYHRNDLARAMRRFNQAWLLNPDYPDVYWGFAAVLLDQNKPCEAAKMSDIVLTKKSFVQPGFYPDAGMTYARCGTESPALSTAEKRTLEAKSEDMFSKAIANEYTLSKWVAARYSWGDYPGAWRKVKEYRKATGKDIDPRLSTALRAKMPEPN